MHAGFAGAREGRAVLAWGQYAIWEAMRITGQTDAHYFNIGRTFAVPRARGAISLETALGALSSLALRHDALRARIRIAADGVPYQVVSAGGEVPVTIVEATEDKAEEAAAALVLEIKAASFDLAQEWPLRAGFVVTGGGRVVQVALALCHTSADGYAADVVVRDLRQLLLRGELAQAPSQQLLDLVAEEESGVGLHRSQRALAHWEAGYRRIPPVMFPDLVAPPGTPRWNHALLESPALEAAVAVVAARHHMSTATVLLTAVTSLLGPVTGHTECAVTPIVHNRFRPETRNLVTTLSQLGLFTLIADPYATFAQTLENAQPAAMRAYRHAQYDQRAWDGMVDQVSAERGVRVYPSCCFNDLRPVDHGTVGQSADDGTHDTADSRLEWLPGVEHFNCDFCFVVTRQSGTLAIGLSADTCRLPRERIESLLRGVEALVVESAFRDARPGDVEVLT